MASLTAWLAVIPTTRFETGLRFLDVGLAQLAVLHCGETTGSRV